MNRVHVISQHKDSNIASLIFINHYVADKDMYEYVSRVSKGGLDRIAETPLDTINYIRSSSCALKIELIYD